MKTNFKRVVALLLCVLTLLSMCVACGNDVAEEENNGSSDEKVVTQDPEEAKTLKVLTIGHSLSVDCGHMLALIADKEGYEDLVVGTLYYSGCSLAKHVSFIDTDSPEYDLYLSSAKTSSEIPTITEGVTMLDAITDDYWDVFVLQGGPFEIGDDATYKAGHIQVIQKFINENKLNPEATFAWHMPWAPPINNTLRDMYPKEDNPYYRNYVRFGDDRTTFYNSLTQCVKDNIITDDTFELLIPSGTAIENALSSYMEETDLYRDYVHVTDLGRVIGAYTWYCKLVGIERLDEIKLNTIPENYLKSITSYAGYKLTDIEKAIILESVNNALAEPLQMTQSQYTERPTD